MVDRVQVRTAEPRDLEELVALCLSLWPGDAEEHRGHMRAVLDGRPPSTLPLVVLVAEQDGRLVGFVEVGLRSHADGCDGARPCGFLEGWYVAPEQRRRGVGRALVAAAEAWCRAQGCLEMASDTWIDADVSQRAHAALGYEVVDRCVHFRKGL